MSPIKAIRERLRMTQAALAPVMGCSQASISAYETGQQTVPVEGARALIAHAAKGGLEVSFDHIYGGAALPEPAKEGA